MELPDKLEIRKKYVNLNNDLFEGFIFKFEKAVKNIFEFGTDLKKSEAGDLL